MKALLALVCLIITGVSFYFYRDNGQTVYFAVTIVFLILTLIFGGLFLAGRVNKNEDIHITE